MSKKNRVFSRSQSKQFFSMKLTWTPPYKNNFIFVILNYFYKGGPYSLPTPIFVKSGLSRRSGDMFVSCERANVRGIKLRCPDC